MKLLTLAAAAALPAASLAWEFTWHSADGEAHIESGKGASECIKVNHAKGELFRLDSKGEKFIDMRMYDNDDCSGDPAGQATKFFTKESSIAIKGFQVVQLNEAGAPVDDQDEDDHDDGSDAAADDDDDDDFTLPTVSSSPTPTPTATDGGAKPTGASGSPTPSPTPSGSFAAPVVGGHMGRVAGAVGVACVVAGFFGY